VNVVLAKSDDAHMGIVMKKAAKNQCTKSYLGVMKNSGKTKETMEN
jgi:hypothetical protein